MGSLGRGSVRDPQGVLMREGGSGAGANGMGSLRNDQTFAGMHSITSTQSHAMQRLARVFQHEPSLASRSQRPISVTPQKQQHHEQQRQIGHEAATGKTGIAGFMLAMKQSSGPGISGTGGGGGAAGGGDGLNAQSRMPSVYNTASGSMDSLACSSVPIWTASSSTYKQRDAFPEFKAPATASEAESFRRSLFQKR